jgi:hypothetical protein
MEYQPKLWPKEEILNAVKPFLEMYERRPIKENKGGMAAPHSFATWFMTQKINPTHIVESGVWHGHSTWVLEQAAPKAEFHCIDPLADYIVYRPVGARYYKEDFSRLSWHHLPRESTLLFFDDHQNAYERLQTCRRLGFKHVIFEDNYPPIAGDCYSLKKILHGAGYIPQPFPKLKFADKLKWLLNPRKDSPPCTVPPSTEHLQWVQNHVKIYYEFPPLFQTELTRWGVKWEAPTFLGPEPLLSRPDPTTQIFFDEAQSYTWICYVQL